MAYSPYKKGDAIDLESKRGLGILVTCNHGNLPTDDDAAAMKRTLDFLQYQVLQLRNEDATLDRVTGMLSDVRVYLKNYNGTTVNVDRRPKAIIFAFAGHGNSVCNKFADDPVDGCECENRSTTSKEDTIKLQDGILRVKTMIVSKFLVQNVMNIPKLFFFDACRGREELTRVTPPRGDEDGEVNYRIDYATIPGHAAPCQDQWMIKTAEYLRVMPECSLGDVMDKVRKFIYERVRQCTQKDPQEYGQDPQMPETLNRLITGPLFL